MKEKRALSPFLRRSQRRMMFLVVIVLGVFFIGMAVLDYLRVRDITLQLATEQAISLIQQVESTAKLATYAEESVRLALDDHLFSVAYLVRRSIEQHGVLEHDLRGVAMDAGVAKIDVFSAAGRLLKSSMGSKGMSPMRVKPPFSAGEGEKVLGFFPDECDGEKYYGVAVSLTNGDFVRVSVAAEELLSIRRTVGLGALLMELQRNPLVRYAVLDTKGGLLAATPDLPSWVEKPGDPLHDKALQTKDLQADFIATPEGPLFEAFTPFAGNPDVILRVGIRTDTLQEIRFRNGLALLIRTVLFFILTAVLGAFLISRQNMRMLEEESERIRREIRSLEADRTLRERLAAMGELAGGVAHEIRNPLNAVTMAAQRLELEFTPEADKGEYRTLVRSMRAEAMRIERIIEDFLHFARPPKAVKRKRDLHETLEQVVETFRPLATARNVDFSAHFAEMPPFSFDADQVRQAVLNLLKNALDAVGADGGVIRLRTIREGKQAAVRVSDNGPGVPAESRRKIFDLYYSTRAGGTGIGLAMVQRIAAEHGGRVEVNDSTEGGAEFTLYLRMEEE